MGSYFELEDVVPLVAKTIETLCAQESRFYRRDEIVAAMETSDLAAKAVARYAALNGEGADRAAVRRELVGNMVDWFSAYRTDEKALTAPWTDRIEGRQAGVWEYRWIVPSTAGTG